MDFKQTWQKKQTMGNESTKLSHNPAYQGEVWGPSNIRTVRNKNIALF